VPVILASKCEFIESLDAAVLAKEETFF